MSGPRRSDIRRHPLRPVYNGFLCLYVGVSCFYGLYNHIHDFVCYDLWIIVYVYPDFSVCVLNRDIVSVYACLRAALYHTINCADDIKVTFGLGSVIWMPLKSVSFYPAFFFRLDASFGCFLVSIILRVKGRHAAAPNL